MTVAHAAGGGLNRTKYKCDICGKIDFWGSSWSSYGSLFHQETCPGDMPCSCSEDCFVEMKLKIKLGQMQLPVLRLNGYHHDVSKKRKGY